MRIIAGSARGTRLAAVPDGVRPLSDRAREGLFSSLGAEVPGSRVLDLYAGTGAIGIEALSRGAASATFVERSGPSMAAIRQNLERTATVDRAQVVVAEALSFLRRGPGPRKGSGGPFDLVFLDPPYDLEPGELDTALELIASGWLPSGPWTVALTRGRKSSSPVIQLNCPLNWVAARQLRYGDSLVTLFREVRWA